MDGENVDWSLYDALSCAALSVFKVQDGDGDMAREAWMAASVSALTAFPEGSPLSAALNLLLGDIGDKARSVPA